MRFRPHPGQEDHQACSWRVGEWEVVTDSDSGPPGESVLSVAFATAMPALCAWRMVAEVDELQPFDAGGVEQFLSRWYGARGNSDDDFTAAKSGIPRELAEWHAAVARTKVPVVFQDYSIALKDLSPGGDGMLPF